jgi:ankyrin repeat protein
MQQLVSGMAAITEATVSERAPKISVADTLDHARRTLSAHREWLQRRLSSDTDELGGVGSITAEASREWWTVADVENDEEKEPTKEHEQRNSGTVTVEASAPPTFRRQSSRRSRVAPVPGLDVLTEEEKDISAGPRWTTGAAEPSSKGDTEDNRDEGGEDTPQEPPSSKRQKTRWASAAVFPATSSPSSDTAPTPVHLFTSRSSVPAAATAPEPLFSPSLTISNPLAAWGSLSSLDNYMESLESEGQTREPGTEHTSHTAPLQAAKPTTGTYVSESENTGNSDSHPLGPTEEVSPFEQMGAVQGTVEIDPTARETDPVEPERSGLEMVDISALQSESTATVLAVGPAPRDRQSSYEVHQVSKLEQAGRGVRMVELRERDPAQLDSTSDVRITPGERMTTTKTPTTSEAGAVEDVLPYQREDSESASVAAGQQAHQTTDTDSVFSDDEVFEPQPPRELLQTERETQSLATTSNSDKSFLPKRHNFCEDTAESVRVTERKVGEESVILQSTNGDLSFQPRLTSTPTGAAALEGAKREGEGVSDNRQQILRKLNLPPLKENRSKSVLTRLPRLKSHTPSSPTISTELKLSRKRTCELPSYGIHHYRHSGLALSPPCPQYGVKQPDITPDSFLWRKRLSSAPATNPSPSSPAPVIEHFDGVSRTPIFKSMMSSRMEQGGRRHAPLRHTMSSPEGEREGIRRVPQSPLLGSQGVGSLDGSGYRGSTTSLYQMQAGPGPLHLAAKCGNGRQIQQLISEGEDVNARDHDGRTPLMYCIHPRGVHLSCASLLVQAGAALDKQASDGSTAIHLASAMGGVSLVEFALLNHADPDVRDFEGRLPLHWATLTQQSSKCAALLLKHSKLDINAVDDAGMTPLMWATYNNNPLVTEFLLGQGADCEEKDRDGMTAMHWAVHQDGVKCLEMLLQADHTYFKDHRGRTVLHLSAETGSLTACDLIIQLRADAVHDLDRMGRTPLHYAAACSRVDVCALLLDRGSDAAHRDLTGKTAIEYARLKRFDYVVALLTCHGTAVADFARTSRSTSVSSLLSRAKSFSNLPTSGDAPVNRDVITESLQAVPSSSERDRGSGVDTSALGDGAFLGRFVLDKNDPVQHFFFWVNAGSSKLHWSRKTDRRRVQEATIHEVHRGPSKALRQNPAYSPSELHQHVFWLKTDSGILDLLAYNNASYRNWVCGLAKIAQTKTRKNLPDGGENAVASPRKTEVKKYRLKVKRSAAVAPALVIENESAGGLRERWSEDHKYDSEVELTTDDSISQGSPQHGGIDDII